MTQGAAILEAVKPWEELEQQRGTRLLELRDFRPLLEGKTFPELTTEHPDEELAAVCNALIQLEWLRMGWKPPPMLTIGVN